MTLRYVYTSAVGLVVLVCVLLFGNPGFAALSLLAGSVFINRNYKMDEREYQLFYQASNYTLSTLIVLVVLLDVFSHLSLFGHPLSQVWMPITVAGMLFFHGVYNTVLTVKS